MDIENVLGIVKTTASPLKRQLLIVAIASRLLEEKGKDVPIVVGGCALSYYSREVYFTADIDLVYGDREALHGVLGTLGFEKRGRYWVNTDLKSAVEVPSAQLIGENSLIEIVEFEEDLRCRIIGIEDLIVDRMNAYKHWKSETDREMVEILLARYLPELDWPYLERKALMSENDTWSELLELKERVESSNEKPTI